MGRKLLNDVDGFNVDEYQGTFTGTFEVRGSDARYLAYDDEVMLVVRARVKPPRLKETKGGDIIRVNVLAIKEAGVVRSDDLKKHLSSTLGLDMPADQLTLDDVEPEKNDVLDSQETVAPADEDTTWLFESEVEVVDRIPQPPLGRIGVTAYREDDLDPSSPAERQVVAALKPSKDAKLAAFLQEGP